MRDLDFEWDNANISHVAEHEVEPEEAEQVILNRPVDLKSDSVMARSEFPTSVKRMLDESWLS